MVETPQPIRLIASRAAAWNHHTGDAMAADGVGSLYQIVREHPDFFVVAPLQTGDYSRLSLAMRSGTDLILLRGDVAAVGLTDGAFTIMRQATLLHEKALEQMDAVAAGEIAEATAAIRARLARRKEALTSRFQQEIKTAIEEASPAAQTAAPGPR